MDYFQMTAPCELDWFNCRYYLANDNREQREKLNMDFRLNGVPPEAWLCKRCRKCDSNPGQKIWLQIYMKNIFTRGSVCNHNSLKQVFFIAGFACKNI